MNLTRKALIATTVAVALTATPVLAQDTIPQPVFVDENGGALYTDRDWCYVLVPDLSDEQADRCEQQVATLADLPQAPHAPRSLVDGLGNIFEGMGATPAPTPSPTPAPTPEPTLVPTPQPQVKNADYRRVAREGDSYTFGPGPKKPFFDQSLRVWINGERIDGDRLDIDGDKGRFTFRYSDALRDGDLVQAKYDRKEKVTRTKKVSRNGSDDFFLRLPRSPDKVRFTVRSDSPYGCSAYVYVWDGGYWEPQRGLSVSFDGWKKKTRQMGWFNDFHKGRQRVWVNTNCPWTLTFASTGWAKVK